MDARFLNVLHNSGDHYILAIGKRIHIHFGCIFEELVNQDRALRVSRCAD